MDQKLIIRTFTIIRYLRVQVSKVRQPYLKKSFFATKATVKSGALLAYYFNLQSQHAISRSSEISAGRPPKKKQRARFHVDHEITEMSWTLMEINFLL